MSNLNRTNNIFWEGRHRANRPLLNIWGFCLCQSVAAMTSFSDIKQCGFFLQTARFLRKQGIQTCKLWQSEDIWPTFMNLGQPSKELGYLPKNCHQGVKTADMAKFQMTINKASFSVANERICETVWTKQDEIGTLALRPQNLQIH